MGLLLCLLLALPLQSSLEAEAASFAHAWRAGDLQTLTTMMVPEGIRLHVQDQKHLRISPRQVRASLRDYLEAHPGGQTTVTRVSRVAADPTQGFAEIRWETRPAGASAPVVLTVFVAFVRQDENWAVTEIRILS